MSFSSTGRRHFSFQILSSHHPLRILTGISNYLNCCRWINALETTVQKSAVPVVTRRHSGWVSSCKLIIWYLPLFFKGTEGIFELLCLLYSVESGGTEQWRLVRRELPPPPVPTVRSQPCWAYQGGGLKEWQREGWEGGGAVRHAVGTCCLH